MYQNSLINKSLKRTYILMKMIKLTNLLKIKYLQVTFFIKHISIGTICLLKLKFLKTMNNLKLNLNNTYGMIFLDKLTIHQQICHLRYLGNNIQYIPACIHFINFFIMFFFQVHIKSQQFFVVHIMSQYNTINA